ncbi:MAG: radical SAM family heme chaperone HemW [Peptostreptococcaceae bacterium]|nr:radical SAM family heme chaperone HemW [Peptostreptococcaceae bacterium]
MNKKALYVHIPFCKSKCNYCDFNSFNANEKLMDEYIQALIKEMTLTKDKIDILDTIFIGGGTPSILSLKNIEKLLRGIYENFSIKDDCEITMESNPKTLNLEKLKLLKSLKINRLSMGVQAVSDKNLKFLGRIHSFEDAKKMYNEALKVGFSNINIDMMFSYPNQSLKEWKHALEEVLKLNPKHLSIYSLILEEGTKLYDLYEEGSIEILDDQLDRQMYYFARDILEQNGYHQYEISNFAKDDYECEHNKIYWRCEEYLGIGLSAHSYLNSKRFYNKSNIDEYIKDLENEKLPIKEIKDLTLDEKIEEKIFMNLRMNEGLSLDEFYKLFDIKLENLYSKEIEKLLKDELVVIKDGVIKLSKRGIDLSNKVFIEFLRT